AAGDVKVGRVARQACGRGCHGNGEQAEHVGRDRAVGRRGASQQAPGNHDQAGNQQDGGEYRSPEHGVHGSTSRTLVSREDFMSLTACSGSGASRACTYSTVLSADTSSVVV